MGIAAFLSVAIAVFPGPLYDILPYPVHYVPYTAAHVVGQLQLVMFGALAFCLLILSGYYPAQMRAINLDTDWFYRNGGRLFYYSMDKGLNCLNSVSDRIFVGGLAGYLGRASGDAPARVTIFTLLPVWILSGARGKSLDIKKKKVYAALRTGTSAVGISAAIVTVFLIIIFILS
jgi:multicomponent Na+:H+ antiporter subunit D